MACTALEIVAARVYCASNAPEKEERREQFSREQPNQIALHWLLSNEVKSPADNELVKRLTRVLTHCLVGENALAYANDWITAKHSRRRSETSRDYQYRVVVLDGFKVRGLCEALTYWTRDSDPYAEALEGCERYQRESRAKSYEEQHVPGSIAAGWLCGAPQTSATSRTAPQPFDRFVSAIPAWAHDVGEQALVRALLALYHPVAPSGSEMLDLLRSHAHQHRAMESPYLKHLFQSDKSKHVNLIYWHGVRAAQILDKQGRHEDARFILDFLYAQMPFRFSLTDLNHLMVPPKVGEVTLRPDRQATKREKAMRHRVRSDRVIGAELGTTPYKDLGGTS